MYNANKNDYITYLQKHSEQNKRIKKPQFHVAISTKGKVKTFDELAEFGKKYMEEMGYGNNPYLMYKHTDTENNHIHIVSSRVDVNGSKISDNYERVRTQKIINEYYGIDLQKEIESKLNRIDRYNVSTIAQYKLLLEKDFKKALNEDFDIQFHNLFAITNLPISRFLDYLIASENYEDYMYQLVEAYNPSAVQNVMCTNTLSVSWDGYLYDCDFNQMLELPVNSKVKHISAYNEELLEGRNIVISQHCYGCTAGAGSSCQGSVA